MRRALIILALFVGLRLGVAEVLPPAPAKYFNDYAQVVSAATAAQLNQTLERFERESSAQILVAVFPQMQSDSSVADYTVRVARAWRVGQQAKNNGAVLFVFVQDHTMFLQVGYGLEAVLPDALCQRIISDQIAPRFKSGDFNGGLTAGVQAIMAATQGEYRGGGTTVAESRGKQRAGSSLVPFIVLAVLVVLILISRLSRGSSNGGGWIYTGGGGGWSGGSGGGWSSGGGGGGFSGGGGSFGGGGAGGSW